MMFTRPTCSKPFCHARPVAGNGKEDFCEAHWNEYLAAGWKEEESPDEEREDIHWA